jgi:signal transduction histidine kinase
MAHRLRLIAAPSRIRLAVVPAALAAGIGAAALMADAPHDPAGGAQIAVALLVGWSFVASGLVAWERRPENPTGKVMVATGLAWFAQELSWAQPAWAWTLGQLLEPAYLLGAGYLLTTFPEGRVGTRIQRSILAVAVLIVGPLQLAWLLFGYGDDRPCAGCPANVLRIADAPGLSEAIVHLQQAIAIGLAIATISLLVARWRSASESRRLAIAPVLVTGAVAFALILPWTINDAVGDPLREWPDVALQLALAGVPVAFLVGLLRTRLARAAVGDLVMSLGGPLEPGALRAALARALRDPTLTVAYWLPEAARHVDADGRPVVLPDGDAGRAITEVQREGRRIAAIVHDPALADEPELVASAGAAAGLALENERLQAELRARLEELHASRARIVEAAEGERRRIERDLHDGTQQRLVSIAMTLGLAQSRLEADPAAVAPLLGQARAGLSDALRELRELAQGIHPGILTERGLHAALEELARGARVPLDLDVELDARLPERVEAAAYFVVSEALTNVAKHARASAVRVRVTCRNGEGGGAARAVVEVADDGVGGADGTRGSGLRGLADRVDALGGRLAVVSPEGRGTALQAEIPCV